MAFANSLDLRFLISADSAQARAAFKALQEDQRALDASVRALAKSTGLLPNQARAVVAEFAKLKTESEQVAFALKRFGGQGLDLVPKLKQLAAQTNAVAVAQKSLAGSVSGARGTSIFLQELQTGLTGIVSNAGPAAGALTRVASSIGPVGLAAGAAAVAVGGLVVALGGIAKSTIDIGSRMDTLSKKTNLSVEALSGLKIAAELGDADLEELASAFTRLQRAAATGTPEAIEALKLFGVTVADINQNLEGAVDTIIRRFAELPPSIQKTNAEFVLFGRSGSELSAAMLEAGIGLDALKDKAREAGTLMSTQTSKALENLGDELTKLSQQLDGLKLQIGTEFIGVLRELLPILNDLATVAIPLFAAAIKTAGVVLSPFTIALHGVRRALDLVRAGFEELRGVTLKPPTGELGPSTRILPRLTAAQQAALDAEKKQDKEKKARAAKEIHDLTQIELVARRLARQLADTRIAIETEVAAANERFRTGEDNAERFYTTISEIEDKALAAQLQFIQLERANILKQRDLGQRARIDLLEGLSTKEAAARNARDKALVAASKAVAEAEIKAGEDRIKAEEELRKRIEEIDKRADEERIRSMLRLRDAQFQIIEDLAREEERAALARADALKRRAQFDPSLRGPAVDAELAAQRRIAENALNFTKARIQADKEAAILEALNARASAETLEQIDRDSQDRRLAAQQTFNARMAEITRQAQVEQQRLNPFSARSILGEDFGNVLDAGGTKLQGFGALVEGVFRDITESFKSVQELFGGAVNTFLQGLGSIVQQYVLLGTTGPAALKKILAATLATIAAESAVQAIFALATGFLKLAIGDFAGATAAFTAAAIFGSIAAVTGLAGRAVAGKSFQQQAGGRVGAGATAGAEGAERTFTRGDITGLVGGFREVVQPLLDKLDDATQPLQQLADRIVGMHPNDVVTIAADGNPEAFARGTARGIGRSNTINRQLQDNLQLRPAR